MTRIGIIGTGRHSTQSHGPALMQYKAEHTKEIELAAVCDLDEEKARRYADDFNFERTYGDVQTMIENESFDAIMVITPLSLTRKIVGKLLPLGIPLMLEKPPGQNICEARELLDISQKYKTPQMISFNRRFNPAIAKARQWLRAEASNRPPRLIISRMLRVARLEPEFITATAIHAVDTVLSFMHAPKRAFSRRWSSRTDTGGQSCQGRIDFENQAIALFVITPDAGTSQETCELIGPEYSIHIDVMNASLEIFDKGQPALSYHMPDDTPEYVKNGTLGETETFLEAVKNGCGFSPNLTDGLLSVRVTEAMDKGGEHTIG